MISMTCSMHHPATWLAGYIPDLPTPFDNAGEVDLGAFRRLCERQIAAGATALVVAETNGEDSTLDHAEHTALVRIAVRASRGRAAIIAGAGSNSTSEAIELTRRAEADGADAVLSVTPYYNKPTQAGLHAHFRAIADSTRVPIILHDVPSRTVRELSDETVAQLAQSPQFIGLRDATGDLARPQRLRAITRRHFASCRATTRPRRPFWCTAAMAVSRSHRTSFQRSADGSIDPAKRATFRLPGHWRCALAASPPP